VLQTATGIIRISLRTVWRFRLRSGLTLLASLLGVAGVISSVDYASGGKQQVLDQIRKMGTNIITVAPKQSRSVGGRARTGTIAATLVEQDYSALRRELLNIKLSSALATGSFMLKQGDLAKSCQVIGCEPDYARIRNWTAGSGSFFDSSDERRLARVAAIGSTVARDLFWEEPAVGKRLLINRVPFEVVGVMAERGQGLDVANEDNQVYVPLSTAMRRLMNVDYYSGLVFELDSWEQMDSSASEIAGVVRRRHRAPGRDPDDFQVQNQKTLIDTQVAAAERLGFFVRWIGISGLVVSGIGTLAIYWIAVRERTVEFGTRRAVGATASHIFFQIVFEAAVVSAFGSLAGVVAGEQSSRAIARLGALPFVFDRNVAILGLMLSLAFNLGFSMIPSARAARVAPVRALTYE
jgi:putative ABC transport system permease protein